uniref:Bet v I/Major latex protein domain-containing protein n=1 Tax=Fagus sylvatica TaxID=28930 RepID=A0A2N9FJB7_FAGSY
MAQIAKIELQTEIKAPAEKFFNIFRSKAHIQPSICPNLIKDVQLLKGDWETVGSVKQWTYIAGNNIETVSETVEAIDNQNKSISFKVLDGTILDSFKNMKSSMQVSPKGDCSLVKWTIEYENANEDVSKSQ